MNKVNIPPNEIVKVFGNYRIIKQYWYSNYERKICGTLKLETKRTNLAGEAYYSLAIEDPFERGECVGQQRAYSLLSEFRTLNEELLKELSK